MKTNKTIKRITLLTLLLLPFSVLFPQVVINMKKDGGVSVIPCKVNGLNLKFIFDTGASDVSISMTEATFMLKNDYLSKDDIVGKSNYLDANGNVSVGVNIILREVEIGGMKLYNVKANVVNNIKAPLLLGQSAISKLGKVQLDLEANTLTILDPKDSGSPIPDTNLTQDSFDLSSPFMAGLSTVDSLLDQARDNYNEDRYQQTIEYCDVILTLDQKNKDAYFLRALAHDMLQDYTSAIKDYDKLIKLGSDSSAYLYYCYRGKSKFDLQDYNGALLDLNKGLLINQKYTKGLIWRAETKEKLKNIPSAISDLDKAILLDPSDSLCFVQRAFLKQDIKDYRGAIIDCNKAISINPQYSRAYYCRGVSKKYLKDYNGAIEDFNTAIDLDPANAPAYTNRGEIKENQYEDFDAAMDDYNKALEISPDYFYPSFLKMMLEKRIKNNVWIKISSSSKGEWFMYNTEVTKENDEIKIWIKNEAKSLTIKKYGKSKLYTNTHSLWLCLFNCTSKAYKILQTKDYNSKGELIDSQTIGEYEDWETVAPQTVIAMILSKVCERYN